LANDIFDCQLLAVGSGPSSLQFIISEVFDVFFELFNNEFVCLL